MSKTPEEYFQEQSFSVPGASGGRDFNAAELTFIRKYMGLDAPDTLRRIGLGKKAELLESVADAELTAPAGAEAAQAGSEAAKTDGPALIDSLQTSLDQARPEAVADEADLPPGPKKLTDVLGPEDAAASSAAVVESVAVETVLVPVLEDIEEPAGTGTPFATKPEDIEDAEIVTVPAAPIAEAAAPVTQVAPATDVSVPAAKEPAAPVKAAPVAAPVAAKEPVAEVAAPVAAPAPEAKVSTPAEVAAPAAEVPAAPAKVAPAAEEVKHPSIADIYEGMDVQAALGHFLRNEPELQMVGFYLSGQEFTVPTVIVQEVIHYSAPTRLPLAPPYVAGAINLRGKVTPLVHLREILEVNKPRQNEDRFIIICRFQGFQVGLLIERVHTMYRVPQKDIDWGIEAHLGINVDYVSGLLKLNDHLVGIVAVDKIVNHLLQDEQA